MKKFILAALIGATTLTPIAASAQERGQWRGRGGGEAREQRQPRQQERAERPQQQQREQFRAQREQFRAQREQQRAQQPQGQRPERQFGQQPGAAQQWRQERRDGQRDWRQERRNDGQQQRQERRDWRQGQVTPGQVRRDDRRDWQQDRRDDRRDWRQDRRGDNRGDWQRDRRDDRRDWRQDGRRDRDWGNRGDRGGNWNRGWRQDRRYDWGNYRARNRNIYRLPRYYAPRGYNYGYQRFSIGLTLGSMLFSSNYWINDPFYYRLPPAYGGYRWVRYYNDALLVDIYSGEVIDVEYDIFW